MDLMALERTGACCSLLPGEKQQQGSVGEMIMGLEGSEPLTTSPLGTQALAPAQSREPLP